MTPTPQSKLPSQFNSFFPLFYLLLAGWATGLVFLMGHWPAAQPDTISYLKLAQNPFSLSGVRFPPGYPLILNFLGVYGLENFWNVSVFNGVCIFLAFMYLEKIACFFLSKIQAMLSTLWAAVTFPLIHPFLYVLSEPVFMVLLTFSFYHYLSYQKEKSISHLVWIALGCLGLPFIRIAGVIFPGFIVCRWIMQARQRWIVATVFVCVAIFLICMAQNAYFYGRYLDPSWTVLHKWSRYPMYLQWYMSYRIADSIFGWVLSVGFIAALIMTGRRNLYISILIQWIIFYCFSIAFFQVFFDHAIPIAHRIMLPANFFYPVLFVYLVIKIQKKPLKICFLIALISACLFNGKHIFSLITDPSRSWSDYSNRQWRSHPILKRIDQIPAGTKIYSSHPDFLWLYNKKEAISIPKLDADTDEKAMVTEYFQNRAIVIYFRGFERRYLIDEKKLTSLLINEPEVVSNSVVWRHN